MKKLVSAITVVLVCIGALNAAEQTIGGYTYTYGLNTDSEGLNTTAYIYGYHDPQCNYYNGWSSLITPTPTNSVTVPSHIPLNDFGNETTGIPIVSVSSGAFARCNEMTEVLIPNSIARIGDFAFVFCSGLTNIVLSSNLQRLGFYSFAHCTKLERIELPDTVTSLGYNGTFLNCSGLKYIRLSPNITSIPTGSFSSCSSLTQISIPAKVESVGSVAFSRTGLEKVEFGQGSCLGFIGENAFYGSSLKDITLPSMVSNIQESAFANCTGMTNFVMRDAVTYLGANVFSGCSSLRSVTLSKNIKQLPNGLFKDCKNLVEVVIPEGVTSIGEEAFYGCASLKSIVIPSSVTTIPKSAFYGCGLTSIDLPSSITTIGAAAFGRCTNLHEIVISDTVTSLGQSAFYSCSALTSAQLGKGIIAVPNNCFSGCSSLTSVIFDDNTWKIGDSAFRDCTSLENVDLPMSVTSIESGAFLSSGLKTVLIPPYTTLGIGAFASTQLTEVTVPKNVQSLNRVFECCTSLTNVVLEYASSIVTVSNNVYEVQEGVSDLRRAFCNCKSLKTIKLPPTVIYISAAFDGCGSLTEITIPESVRDLGGSTFSNCTNELLTVVIPNSVTNIGNNVFNNFRGTIVFPENPPTLSYKTFEYSHPSKIVFLGELPSPSNYLAGVMGTHGHVGTYVVTSKYLYEWLQWFTENEKTNYKVLDSETEMEAQVVVDGNMTNAVGAASALGISPAREVIADGVVQLTYREPTLKIESFNPSDGTVSVKATPGEGCLISGNLAVGSVVVEGTNDLSGEWDPIPLTLVETSNYTSEDSSGEFSCKFSTEGHSFFKVKIVP